MLHILSFGFSFISSCVWVPQLCTDSRELSKENPSGNFPGGPKSLPFNAGVMSLISGHGSKVLHAPGQLNWQFPTREACALQEDSTQPPKKKSFVLEVSWWMMFHSWVDQLIVEVDRDQIQSLIENNQCYIMWEIANILKICKKTSKVILPFCLC